MLPRVDRLATWQTRWVHKTRSAAVQHVGQGQVRGGSLVRSPCQAGLKSERKKASHHLLDAITFETASTSLLLHLACGSMASSSTVTVASGGGEFNVLLVDS